MEKFKSLFLGVIAANLSFISIILLAAPATAQFQPNMVHCWSVGLDRVCAIRTFIVHPPY